MKVLFTIGISLLLFSCHRNAVPQATTTEVKDSIVYKVVPHDTTIYIPGAMVEVHDTTPVPCPEWNFDTVATNGNVKLHVNITRGHLTASCKADSLQRVINLLSGTLEHYRFQNTAHLVPVAVPVQHIPKWVWWLLGINAAFVLYRFRKPLINLFP